MNRLQNLLTNVSITPLIIATMSALTISGAISQKVNAQTAPYCTNATITGSYGTKFLGDIAAVGLVSFNGTGQFQGTDTINSYGTVLNRTVSGTYSVNRNCTLQIVYTDGVSTAVFNATIVDGAKEIFLIQSSPNALLTGTFKRVN